MLWSTHPCRPLEPWRRDVVRPLQSSERRLRPARRLPKRTRTSPEVAAALLCASDQNGARRPVENFVAKGITSRMRELVQIDATAEHACGRPSIERWEVLEPISGRWSWMRVFGCCSQIVIEPREDLEQDQPRVKRAA